MLYMIVEAAAPQDDAAWVGPGLLGFVVIAAIGVATVLLWRNMNKQLRKVRFEEPEPRRRPGPGQPPAGGDRPGPAGGPGDTAEDGGSGPDHPGAEDRRR
ncbi:hypothetical protein SAMN05421678_102523 [Actinopolymorpha cephalotaxi]|uniref:Uncharacterized protein n=1 Tax=Actinopolymorpha cephalotaxi TaxID=504797 RepID=A0A1I2MAE1_9ACTN|nr:hypothetical protein [Actinopolymorpha cephalotaxi]NYH81660.1 hypothetical protein [Actinopolymorpha cephalotaxi]SFF88433.1 hypothetical protein SAMN05421678_102523 [Actinopolymorpha cephalotaxi]